MKLIVIDTVIWINGGALQNSFELFAESVSQAKEILLDRAKAKSLRISFCGWKVVSL